MYLILLMLSASICFISCAKKRNYGPARLLVANAAITAPVAPSPLPTAGPSVDVKWGNEFLFNNIVYGSASSSTGISVTTINNPQVISTVGYGRVSSTAQPLNLVVTSGTPAPNTGLAGLNIYSRITSFLPDRNYTAVANNLTPFYNVAIMEDDLSAPPPGKVKVRLVHAIPQSLVASLPRRDTVDITATGGTASAPLANANVFPARTFGDVYTNTRLHQFAELDSGSYRFGVRVAGTPGTSQMTGLVGLLPTPPAAPLRLLEGKIYTIIVRINFPTLTTAPVGLTFITHN